MRQYLTDQRFKLTAITFSEEGAGSVPSVLPTNCETTLPHLWRGYGERMGALNSAKVGQKSVLQLGLSVQGDVV